MRLVMMGTGPFAVPTFRALFQSPHEVRALVTQPLRPAHGRGKELPNPLREIAAQHSTPVYDPESINTDAARTELVRFEPELLVVADYGQILSPETLATARHGGINLHGSLLPRYRGAAPIQWAVYHGDAETGVTVIHMTPALDAGPCVAQLAIAIDPEETAGDLEPRLSEAGAPLVLDVIARLGESRLEAIPQNNAQATRARRLKKSDGLLDFARPALALKNQIRAFEPWPKSFTFWLRSGQEPLRLIVSKAAVAPGVAGQPPGTVLAAEPGRLIVAAGADALELLEVQPAGKRQLAAQEFLRGYPVAAGDKFGSAPAGAG
jgi:methionyl-tRNA formyltransferase